MLKLNVSGSSDISSSALLYSELGASSRLRVRTRSRERLASATYWTLSITTKVLISTCGARNRHSGRGSMIHCGGTVCLVRAAASGRLMSHLYETETHEIDLTDI